MHCDRSFQGNWQRYCFDVGQGRSYCLYHRQVTKIEFSVRKGILKIDSLLILPPLQVEHKRDEGRRLFDSLYMDCQRYLLVSLPMTIAWINNYCGKFSESVKQFCILSEGKGWTDNTF